MAEVKEKKLKEPDSVIRERMDLITNPPRKVDLKKLAYLGKVLGESEVGSEKAALAMKEVSAMMPLMLKSVEQMLNLSLVVQKAISSYHRTELINTALFTIDNVLTDFDYYAKGEVRPTLEKTEKVLEIVIPAMPLKEMPKPTSAQPPKAKVEESADGLLF